MLKDIDFVEKLNNTVFLPSRRCEDDVSSTIIDTNNHHWKHLNLPYIYQSLWKAIEFNIAVNDTDEDLKGGNVNNGYL